MNSTTPYHELMTNFVRKSTQYQNKAKNSTSTQAAQSARKDAQQLALATRKSSMTADGQLDSKNVGYIYKNPHRSQDKKKLNPRQIDRVIKASYNPLKSDSVVKQKVEQELERSKSQFQRMQDIKNKSKARKSNISI